MEVDALRKRAADEVRIAVVAGVGSWDEPALVLRGVAPKPRAVGWDVAPPSRCPPRRPPRPLERVAPTRGDELPSTERERRRAA